MTLPDPATDLVGALEQLATFQVRAHKWPTLWAVFQHSHPELGPWVRAVANEVAQHGMPIAAAGLLNLSCFQDLEIPA